jgi:hypothetical protein
MSAFQFLGVTTRMPLRKNGPTKTFCEQAADVRFMCLIDGYLTEPVYFKLTCLIIKIFLFDSYLMVSR